MFLKGKCDRHPDISERFLYIHSEGMFWISRHRRVRTGSLQIALLAKGAGPRCQCDRQGVALIKSCFLQCEHGHQNTPLVPAPRVPELFGPGTKVGRRVRCTQVLNEASPYVLIGLCLCWK